MQKKGENMKKRMMIASTVFAVTMGLTMIAHAEETTGEKAKTNINKATDEVKKDARAASDDACEMVNGKMHCVGKKMKHKMQNTKDKMSTKAEEAKDKVD